MVFVFRHVQSSRNGRKHHSLCTVLCTAATGNGTLHAGHDCTPSPPASPISNPESHEEDESFIDPVLQSSQDFEATQTQSSQVCSLPFMH